VARSGQEGEELLAAPDPAAAELVPVSDLEVEAAELPVATDLAPRSESQVTNSRRALTQARKWPRLETVS